MISVLHSQSQDSNPHFIEADRQDGEDNLQWLSRNIDRVSCNLDSIEKDWVVVMLVGGKNSTAFRLRVAQSHLRHDLSPSHWSHVMLLDNLPKDFSSTNLAACCINEISLEPAQGFGFPPPSNGVQVNTLAHYRDPVEYPNIALMLINVSKAEIELGLEKFRSQRSILDALELVLRWLAFTWGVAKTGNPLLEGQGIPSAAMLEIVFGAAGFDLTPGLESRASCPEAIWQAARWWDKYYHQGNRDCHKGAFCTSHKL